MSDTVTENSKRRVANYELDGKIDLLTAEVRSFRASFDDYCGRADKRYDDHEARLREVEKTVTTMKTNQGVLVAAQSTLTLIASVIAGWFGSRQ